MTLTLRLGSLCSGYGGLEMGMSAVLPLEVVWVADINTDASKILAHHWPDVPNLGDITAVDWTQVTPIDVLCAGFPCQDVSHAGLRKGLRDGNRSGLWTRIAETIGQLEPSIVLLENVRGLLSVGADSGMEPCPWCVGDDGTQPVLRALGAVLGDLASLGFDAEWTCVRASEIAAPHRRERVFILAWSVANSTDHGQQRGGAPRGRRS